MAKETKTVGKTTQTNQTKKGGNIMTNQDHIKRTLNIIKYQTNSYITNINKKHHTRVEYITDKELQQIIENSSNKQQIIDALAITSMLINKAKDNKVKEYYLNKAYGKEDITFNELSDEERELINKRRVKQQEIKEARQQEKRYYKPIYIDEEELAQEIEEDRQREIQELRKEVK